MVAVIKIHLFSAWHQVFERMANVTVFEAVAIDLEDLLVSLLFV